MHHCIITVASILFCVLAKELLILILDGHKFDDCMGSLVIGKSK